MGGFGSGPYAWGGGATTVEECLAWRACWADVQLFSSVLGVSVWSWRVAAREQAFIGVAQAANQGANCRAVQVFVRQTEGGEAESRETIHMIATTTPLGGARWWWVCPGCHKRRGAVYVRPGSLRLRCRVCHGLSYASRNVNRRAGGSMWVLLANGLGCSPAEAKAAFLDTREERLERSRERRNALRRAKRSTLVSRGH